jgi:hypothetical protein
MAFRLQSAVIGVVAVWPWLEEGTAEIIAEP